MARLNKTRSGQLMAIMDKPGWEALMLLLAETIADLNERQVPGTNAFETLRALHIREGKVAGLKEFFKDIEDGVSMSDLPSRT